MGRRDRERIERIKRGEENPIAQLKNGEIDDAKRILRNPFSRKAVAIASKGTITRELQNAPTEDQIEVLSGISPSKVGKALMQKAPREMDKGIHKLLKEGKKVTVSELCREIRETPSFLRMSEQAGVPYKWYEELAKQRMKAFNL